MKTNKYGIWVIIILRVLILVGIFYEHNAITLTGKTILLKTEPVDPRDPFKGDYVNLRFDISRIEDQITEEQKKELEKTHKIFAVLKPALEPGESGEKYYVLGYFTTKRPGMGVTYIQGNVWGELDYGIEVNYNIENYFLPEGLGKEIETHLGKDLFVEIYVNIKGMAQIKNLILNNKPYPIK